VVTVTSSFIVMTYLLFFFLLQPEGNNLFLGVCTASNRQCLQP